MKKIAGISVVVLALVIAIAPMFLDCQSQGKSLTTSTGMSVPMKCHWTGVAMLGAGAPLTVVGGSMFASKRKQTWRALSILGTVLGAVVILMPTTLIGVCANPDDAVQYGHAPAADPVRRPDHGNQPVHLGG